MIRPQAGILHSDWKSRLLQSRLEPNIPAWKDGYNTWRKASSELYTEEPMLLITLRHTRIRVWLSLHGHKRKTGRMCSTVKSGFFQGVVGMTGGPLGRGVWRNGKHLLFILYTSVSSVQFSRSAVSGSLQPRGHIPNGHKPLYDLSILQKVWILLFDLNFLVFYKKSEGLEKQPSMLSFTERCPWADANHPSLGFSFSSESPDLEQSISFLASQVCSWQWQREWSPGARHLHSAQTTWAWILAWLWPWTSYWTSLYLIFPIYKYS